MWLHVIWYKFSSVQEVTVATIWSIGDGNSRFFWNSCKFVSHFHHHFGATTWFPPWSPLWNFPMPFCLLPWFSVVNSTFSTHRHLFLPVCLLSLCPACISWGFLKRVVLQGEGVSLMLNHRLVDQTSTFLFPETVWSSYTPGHWVSILVTSYDRHGLCWGYPCFQPPHGECITLYSAIYPQSTLWEPQVSKGVTLLISTQVLFYTGPWGRRYN